MAKDYSVIWKANSMESIDSNIDIDNSTKIEKSNLGAKAIYYYENGKQCGVPYSCIKRIFKRIETINTRLSCCRVNFDAHSIVLCDENETEIAEIKYKDQREADYVYKFILSKVPEVIEGKLNPIS